jgi:putative DNA primase/helicase
MDRQAQISIDALKRIRDKKDAERVGGHATDGAQPSTNPEADQSGGRAWPEPKPLPNGLTPVEPFSLEFVPNAVAPWIDDIANRLQCPPDYVAVAALTALGAVIGRRIGVKPQAKTDWIEFPNVWGAFIGRPGMLKSPAMGEALKPIHHLEAEAAKENEVAAQAYKVGLSAYKLRTQVATSLAKKELKTGKSPDIKFEVGEEPEEPLPVRYRTNDCSYEAVGELLIANPAGILIERDELVSLLQHLDREDQAVARGFFLSAWSGKLPYTFDRIVRGHRHIDAACVSVLGNTQPARIAEYIHRANYGGAGGDGLIQRFGLLIWPDAPADWKDVDQYPHRAAREKAWAVFERIAKIDQNAALKLGAEKGPYDKVPALRFDEAALSDFLDWRKDLERQLRSGELSPSLEGHLAKYRKLVPALALIHHIADSGEGLVSQRALLKALATAHYLKSHARRVYGSADEAELAAAKAILARIKTGDLQDGFTARDVHQHGWAHLTEREHVAAGLRLLVDLDYLADSVAARRPQGGRPKVTYSINPSIWS